MGHRYSKVDRYQVTLDGVRARGHSKHFYDAMDAALQGRYTQSELSFHRALFKHPIHAQHTKLLLLVEDIWRRREKVREQKGGWFQQSPASHHCNDEMTTPSSMSDVDDARDGFSRTPSAAQSRNKEPQRGRITTDADGLPIFELEISTGKDLEMLVSYLQMQQDIEHVYIACNTTRARQLALVYSQLNCIWMQLIIFYFRKLKLELRQERERKSLDATTHGSTSGERKKRSRSRRRARSSTRMTDADEDVADEDDLDCFIDLYEQMLRYFLISSIVNYGTLALEYAEKLAATDGGLGIAEADAKDDVTAVSAKVVRKQQRVYSNVEDLCQVAVDAIWDVADDHPEEYISRVLFKVMPPRTPGMQARGSRQSEGRKGALGKMLRATGSTEWTNASTEDAANHLYRETSTTQGTESESTSHQNVSDHLLSRMTKLFVDCAEGKGGGTFLVESRTFTPLLSVVLPLRDLHIPVRLTVPTNPPVHTSDLAFLSSPHQRLSWESTGWTLPPGASLSGHGFPITSDFLLVNALPEYYCSHETETGRLLENGPASIKYALPRKKALEGPPMTVEKMDAYVDEILKYTRASDTTCEAMRMTVVGAGAEEWHAAVANSNINIFDPRMRSVACMDENATCMELVYILLSKAQRLSGNLRASHNTAAAAVLQTACLRGPESHGKMRMHLMLKDMNLL